MLDIFNGLPLRAIALMVIGLFLALVGIITHDFDWRDK